MSRITDILKESGFYRMQEQTDALCAQAQEMNRLAGTRSDVPVFEAFPSFIPSKRVQACVSQELVIDIGGTSTKVGLRTCTESDGHSWNLLFEKKNDEFRPDDESGRSAHSFKVFVDLLSQAILEEARSSGVAVEDIHYCGIIWSNAVTNRFDPEIGVTGIVASRSKYSKGEWFLRDLKDGDNLGELFTDALHEVGIPLRYLILSNDTVFTMTALPDSDAGMVASTGLNGTIVKELSLFGETQKDQDIICNGEIGGRFVIEDSLFSEGDWISDSQKARTIEDVTAGRFLPLIFVSHIRLLAENGVTELAPLLKYFESTEVNEWEEYRAKDMALLFVDKPFFLERRKNPELYTREVLDILETLSHELYVRSAHLCSIVAYGTIANKIEEGKSFVIALDSRLSREVPLFRDQFNRSLEEILPETVVARVQLVEPLVLEDGKISVPMQGAANALDSLVATELEQAR